MLICLKVEKKIEGVVRSTAQIFFDGIQANKRWPYGLRQKSSLAALTWAYVEWPHLAHVALRINDFCQQRNSFVCENRA